MSAAEDFMAGIQSLVSAQVQPLRQQVESLQSEIDRLKAFPQVEQSKAEWQRIDKFSADTGIPEDTVRDYRKNGVWPDGLITSVRGKRIYVNLPAYNEWVRTGRVAA